MPSPRGSGWSYAARRARSDRAWPRTRRHRRRLRRHRTAAPPRRQPAHRRCGRVAGGNGGSAGVAAHHAHRRGVVSDRRRRVIPSAVAGRRIDRTRQATESLRSPRAPRARDDSASCPPISATRAPRAGDRDPRVFSSEASIAPDPSRHHDRWGAAPGNGRDHGPWSKPFPRWSRARASKLRLSGARFRWTSSRTAPRSGSRPPLA